MHILQHRVPDAVIPAFLFLCIVGMFIWAFLWQRLGPIRSSLWAALIVWGGLVLALTLAPKRKFRGQVDKARSCDIQVIPDHVLGVFTNGQRVLSLILYVPLGVLLIFAARHYTRIIAGAAIVIAPIGVETVQYVLPRLRRTCQSVDVYDSWTGLAIGIGIGIALLIGIRRTAWGRARADAKHRIEAEKVNPVEVVRVFWPPDERVARGEPPIATPSSFVPSGAKVVPPPPPRPHAARQVKRQQAQQVRDASVQDELDRETERDRRAAQSRSSADDSSKRPSGASDRRR